MLEIFNYVMARILLLLLIWNAYILVFNKGVPNIRTAPAIRRKIIEQLKEHFRSSPQKNKPYKIVDMGSGNGSFAREIAREFPDAEVIGLEWSRLALAQSRLFQKILGPSNIKFKRQDFYKYDLSDTDAVVMYLTIYDMARMGKKLKEELKSGAFVSCNRFRLKEGWQPKKIFEIDTLYPHQKQLHIYKKAA